MKGFFQTLEEQRWDDHRYYHHSRINQALHLVSAISFLIAYVLVFFDPAVSALIGWLVAMTTRQAGHFFFEPKGYDEVNQAMIRHWVEAMGDRLPIYTDDEAAADKGADAVFAEMHRLDKLLTIWDEDSDVAKINAAAGKKAVAVGDETFTIIERALAISRELGLGDLLALYTDGVVETPDANGEEFGNARLVEILTRHQDMPLSDLLSRVIEAVDRWSGGGPPHDDVTLVLARTR